MMVRWMCGVSLKDRRHNKEFHATFLVINCVADVVRRGKIEMVWTSWSVQSVDVWVSACRGLVVEWARGRGRSRKTLGTVCEG